MPDETPKERFLRNHQENVGVMLARAVDAERRGDTEAAAAIRRIADAWDEIAKRARGHADD